MDEDPVGHGEDEPGDPGEAVAGEHDRLEGRDEHGEDQGHAEQGGDDAEADHGPVTPAGASASFGPAGFRRRSAGVAGSHALAT